MARLQRRDPDFPTDLGWETVDATELDIVGFGADVAEVSWVGALAAGEGHDEDVTREGSTATRMASLFASHAKPFVAIVDGGAVYDAMAALLRERGVPTFRTADRALRMLGTYLAARCRD